MTTTYLRELEILISDNNTFSEEDEDIIVIQTETETIIFVDEVLPSEGKITENISDLPPKVHAAEVTAGANTYYVDDEIANLSAQLDHNPAKIYAYVRDEIGYTPYYGYMKGSLWTMWERSANDFNQLHYSLTCSGPPAMKQDL
jgi:hypothetical protein